MKVRASIAMCRRKGALSLTTLIFFNFVVIGLLAISIDVGYLMQTRTQLQATADSAVLSGGTELMSGLRSEDPVTPSTVVSKGSSAAVEYAAKHRNGDQFPTFADPSRDVRFGWAKYDFTANPPGWATNWGQQIPTVGGYNLIGVTLLRNQAGSTSGDQPLPLFFGQLVGRQFNDIAVDAAAVILPATGIRIEPGSTTTTNFMPFAVRRVLWEKYLRAQLYYAPNGFPSPVESVIDDPTGEPLFGHYKSFPNGTIEFKQDFDDLWNCGCTSDQNVSTSTAGPDTKLEIDIFPKDDYTAGNMGTVDFGSAANETSALARQIRYGPNESDLAYYVDNTFKVPSTTGGDTGLSAGIKDDLAAIIGHCRVIVLFDDLRGVGNNTEFDIVEMAGVRVMDVKLTGKMDFKHLTIQRCDATLAGGIGNIDDQIGVNTTVFTPLILIE
jgi:hypothetical protein